MQHVKAAATTVDTGARRPALYRGLSVLIVSQLLAGVGVASGVAVGGLLAQQLTGTTAFAGFAQTCSVLGAGVWAIPLARLAGRRSRRWGLAVGYGLATCGVLLIFTAVTLGWVPLLFVAFGFFGAATAAGLQARFAATELVGSAYRARAMSFVLWSTTLGSVAGPNLSQLGADLGVRLGIERLTGPYLFSLLAFALAAATIGIGLRPGSLSPASPPEATVPDVPEVEGETGGQAESGVAATGDVTEPVRPSGGLFADLRVALRNRLTLLAVVTISCSHTVMVGVMVMSPVHMYADGFALSLVGLVISFHIIGMYGASPLFGALTDKISARGVVVIAIVIFAAALTLGMTAGTARPVPMSFTLGLLGLGWSAGMIGGSTLLTETVPAELKSSVQGATDAVMNIAAAASSALSGLIMDLAGFPALSVVAAIIVVPIVILSWRFRREGGGAVASSTVG